MKRSKYPLQCGWNCSTRILFILLVPISQVNSTHSCGSLTGGVDYPLANECNDSNYIADRSKEVHFIAIHTTEGSTIGGGVDTLLAADNTSSVHYIIDGDGTIIQMVKENKHAYHLGNDPWSEHSIGIEHVGFADKTNLGLTPERYDRLLRTSATLVRHLAAKYNVPLRRVTRDEITAAGKDPSKIAGILAHADVPSPNPA